MDICSEENKQVKKRDRRVSRTRKALRASLLALVVERGYETVTIEDITARADLGRTTFYLHYHDKEELFLETIGELVDDLVAQIAQIPISAWILPGQGDAAAADTAAPIMLTFQHAADNASLYRLIMRGEAAYAAKKRLHKIIQRAVIEFLQLKQEKENLLIDPQVPLDIFASYLAVSWMGIISWWLEEEMPYYPEEMAQMFQKMFLYGAIEVLGVKT
jgi:AcrR family transcriptional regulator